MSASQQNPRLKAVPADGSKSFDSSERGTSGALSPGAVAGRLAVFSADLDGRITACNQAFTEILAHDAEQVIGQTFASFLVLNPPGPKHQQQLEQAVLTCARDYGVYSSSHLARLKSGASLNVQLSVTLLRDQSSVPCGLIAWVAPVQGKNGTSSSSTRGADAAAAGTVREIDGTQFVLASPIMHKFMGLVDRVAGHSETALVIGETGTGKEFIARTIHESSHRRGRAWVDINCAALPENLVESELFGYEKGAFSGADSSKPGLFEMADKGTLFLDEIGELQPHTQVKLLRVLDGQPFYRLGGHRKIKVDVRIVAATNQDLEAGVKEGRFRKDLFHRLSQFQLRVPPLRERPEDIVALAEYFLRLKSPSKSFAPDAISVLLAHPWPGNIRELRNLVAKIAMECPGPEIEGSTIRSALSGEPSAMRQTASMPVGNLDSMEEQMIIKALERTGGHRALAAEQLGISRRTLSRKLKEYNINFAPGDTASSLGFISSEQQKFFRARVQIPVTLKNARGDELHVQGVNLSTGGMGLDGLVDPLRFAGLLDVNFVLPDTDIPFHAKARLMWIGDEGRVGIRFAVIEPALFEQLQHWTNRKMKEEGWEVHE
jgi:two-component system, NtrC family, response regulator AtoC